MNGNRYSASGTVAGTHIHSKASSAIKKFIAVALAFLCLFATAVAALAEPSASPAALAEPSASPAADTGSAVSALGTKKVRVGYVNVTDYEEGRAGEYKRGAGYEYLQRIRYITGWEYEYVYDTFKNCLAMVENGEIDLFGNVSYTQERAEKMLFSSLPQSRDTYWIYTLNSRDDLATGDPSVLNGKKIGATEGSYHEIVLRTWLDENDINAEVVPCLGYDDSFARLASGEIDAIASPNLDTAYGYRSIFSIGNSDCYFVVSKARPDLLAELNAALYEIQNSETDFNTNLAARYFQNMSGNTLLNSEEKAWILAHGGVMRLGILEDSLPFAAIREDGTVSGVLEIVMAELKECYDITYTAKEYRSHEELGRALLTGEIDVCCPVMTDYYLGEQIGLVMSSPIISTTPVLAQLPENEGKKPVKLAVSDNFIFNELAAGVLFPGVQLVYCATIEECLEAVVENRADTAVITSAKINRLRSNPLFGELSFTEVLRQVDEGAAATLANRRAISIINKAISRTSGLLNGMSFATGAVADTGLTFKQFLKQNMITVLTIIGALMLVFIVLTLLLWYRGRQLNKALKAAHDASKAKTAFLFNMSHDIRTPMNAILGFTKIAEASEVDPQRVKDCLKKTREAGNLLLSLINSVLEMSRIEAGKAELDEQPGKVDFAFKSIESTMTSLAEEKNIDLKFEFGPITDHYIYADYDRGNRIFVNIISNAIKYTPEGGKVRVRCEQAGVREDGCGLYRFTFTDNGVGMSEEFQKHLFDEFAREKTSTVTGVQGSGLGLSVVKSFVDLMGGTIECESKLNEGSTFTVTLPFRLQEDAQRVKYFDPDTQKFAETSVAEDQAAPKKAHAAHKDIAGRRVLLVEDNEMNREIAHFILEEAHLVVEEANDGDIAVALLKEKGPDYYDALLMDIQMPNMDGYEATRAIRAMYPEAKLPIIAVSANAFAEDRAASQEAGMDAHIAKPINPEELIAVLNEKLQ